MNKYLTLFFFIVLGLHSLGQSNLGLKFGLNISNVKRFNGYDFTGLVNFNTGVIAKFKLTEKFVINTELLLSNKGFNYILIPNGTTATTLTYITIPTLIEYKASKRIYFQLGPEFNYLIKARMKNSSFNESVYDNYKKFDFSIAGGLGFRFLKNFAIEARYSLGLSQIRQNEYIFGSYKTRTLQVDLTYNFKRKK